MCPSQKRSPYISGGAFEVLLEASCISDVCEDLATDEEKNLWRLGNSKPCFAASL